MNNKVKRAPIKLFICISEVLWFGLRVDCCSCYQTEGRHIITDFVWVSVCVCVSQPVLILINKPVITVAVTGLFTFHLGAAWLKEKWWGGREGGGGEGKRWRRGQRTRVVMMMMMMMMMSGWVEQPFKHNHNHWLSDSKSVKLERAAETRLKSHVPVLQFYNETQQRCGLWGKERQRERAMDRQHNQKWLNPGLM